MENTVEHDKISKIDCETIKYFIHLVQKEFTNKERIYQITYDTMMKLHILDTKRSKEEVLMGLIQHSSQLCVNSNTDLNTLKNALMHFKADIGGELVISEIISEIINGKYDEHFAQEGK